ncbi:F0F1 ATP synthase subunit delta [Polynucleobacter sp. 30F-ANTBAC]|jgi:F-type H+-transporting ATPase subunit delta|uniref:F0F1 ATP synthase subunit delta n=1 Tax=Polynucleobacter sp. 30F-ANTBAC TaxID=2689095 RepID=UPI001C0C38AD|nr:F0F1 ATP synthase subunit delta [Polynucleobacter sp. 30F-ANTBAC]MBU3600003.1 F0F1 ATP synthase subunit delta [Polynucleobacter sp. 30F-ANTBAC]
MADLATIARPYAEALFRSAKPAELSAIAEQLEELAQVASNPDLLAVANNPKLADADLLQILLSGMKTKPADIVKNFVEVLTHNNRLLAMPEIAAQFTALKNAQEGAAEVLITSAFSLQGEELNSLLSTLKKRFGGRELRPTVNVDPELIGGVRVQVGDEVLDTSVKARLASMQAALSA